MADQTIPMVSPDGKDTVDVPADQVEHFKSLGAKVVVPPPPPSLGRRLAKGALDSLPGIGGVVGGVISTPETGGVGTIPGIALGAGVGRGVRDLIGHYSGLDEPTTAMQKAGHIVGDTAMTAGTAAILPGLATAVKAPLETARLASEHFGSAMPQWVRNIGKLLPSLPEPPARIPEFPGWPAVGEATPRHLDLSRELQPSSLSQQEISERLAAVQRAGGTQIPPTAARPISPRPPITVSPSSPMQPPVTGKAATLADTAGGSDQRGSLLDAIHGPNAPSNGNGLLQSPIRAVEGRPTPLYPSRGTVKGVTSNNLEAASNQALAAGHWDEAERLIGQSLQSFFQGSGGPMAGILAAAIAHKARQVVEPLRADPSFQQAQPAKQQQMIQNALRQPGARASLTSLLGSQR